MDRVFNRLRNLDAYPKVNEDFYSRTLSGGVITLVSSVFIALLFLSEFRVEWLQKMPNGVYQYFIKVVPTAYTPIRGHTINSNQFSVTEHYKSAEDDHFRSPPGVFFYYDLSPIKVTFREKHTPFLHFLTHICAIVGGTFTVAGIVASFIYHGNRAIRKKVEIGKLR